MPRPCETENERGAIRRQETNHPTDIISIPQIKTNRSALLKTARWAEIMDLPGQPGDVLHPIRVLSEEVSLMSDYELIMIILTIGLVVIHVIDLQNKK
jgi:hypothetical protein